MDINGVSIYIVLLILAVLFALAFIANRKYNIINSWIDTIKKLAPLWLVFFPAFITYFFVCGSLSAATFVIYGTITGKNFNTDVYFGIEKWVEYVCSFFMPLLYFRILTKNKFPGFWAIIITLVHMLVAGYRDAKLIQLPHSNDPVGYTSGPKIFVHFQWLDALFPLLSFLIFYFLFKERWQKPKTVEAEAQSTVNG